MLDAKQRQRVERFLRMIDLQGGDAQGMSQQHAADFRIIPQRAIERGIDFRKRKSSDDYDPDLNHFLAEYMVKRAKWYPAEFRKAKSASPNFAKSPKPQPTPDVEIIGERIAKPARLEVKEEEERRVPCPPSELPRLERVYNRTSELIEASIHREFKEPLELMQRRLIKQQHEQKRGLERRNSDIEGSSRRPKVDGAARQKVIKPRPLQKIAPAPPQPQQPPPLPIPVADLSSSLSLIFCAQCHQTFWSAVSYQDHLFRAHGDYYCPVCKEVFRDDDSYLKHLWTEHRELAKRSAEALR